MDGDRQRQASTEGRRLLDRARYAQNRLSPYGGHSYSPFWGWRPSPWRSRNGRLWYQFSSVGGVALEDPRVRQSRELVEVADARLALDLSDLVQFVRSKSQESPGLGSEPAQPPGPDIEKGTPEQDTAALDPIAEEDPASLSALSLLTPVKTGAPSLRQLSTPEEIAEDQLTDQIDDVSAREAGKRYGQRWLHRIEEATLERFLARNSRPMMPRRFDIDLLWYVSTRGRDINQEEERREARNGFWDALEQHAVTPQSVIDREEGETAWIAPQDESPR